MAKKIMFFALASILAGILLVSNVMALGITPGRTTYMFEPGVEKTFSFSVVNSEHKDMELSILIKGDLSESIFLSESRITMSAEEGDKRVDVTLKIPAELAPGIHTADIIVTQSASGSDSGGTFLGASLGVVTQVYVIVPYPGKYIIASANVVGPDEDGNLIFVFPVISRGDDFIEQVSASVDIFDSKNRLIATIRTDEQSISPSERIELVGRLSQNLPLGNYELSAVIYYDGESINLRRMFSIGEPLVELKEIKVENFRLGGIAKFEMTVENKWSEELRGAYSKMKIYNSYGGILTEFQSAPIDIPALSTVVLTSYWDSAGAQKMTYDAVLSLIYEDKTNEKRFKLEVEDNKINIIGVSYVISKGESAKTSSSIILMLIIAIVVLALINLAWFLLIRKRLIRR